MAVVEAESINKGLAEAIDGDACWDASRILRVPGTLNRKNDTPCYIASEGDDVDVETLRGYAVEITRYSKAERWSVPAAIDHNKIEMLRSEFFRRDVPKGQRSDADWRMACVLAEAGWTNDEIAYALVHAPWGKALEAGKRYIARTLANVRHEMGTRDEVMRAVTRYFEATTC